jgi:hypothetical protein
MMARSAHASLTQTSAQSSISGQDLAVPASANMAPLRGLGLVTDDRFELTPLGTLGEASDDRVPEPAAERTRELSGPICAAG